MAPQQSSLDRTFVNLTHDPAEGRGARRTYIRRAVMKSYHERRSQKKRASKLETDVAENKAGRGLAALMASIDRQMAPQSSALVSTHISTGPFSHFRLHHLTESDTQIHSF